LGYWIIIIIKTAEEVMITINSFSADKNIPIQLVIEGTTPTVLTLVDIQINYNTSTDINPDVVDYNGTIRFYGTPADYDAFGKIEYGTHRVTVIYGGVAEFHGFLLPAVYDQLNTGFGEYFDLNFESGLSSLGRVNYEKDTNLYTIRSIMNEIIDRAEIASFVNERSFTESLSDIMVYNLNFINDDKEFESYLTILNWVCSTLSMKAVMGWDNVLYLTSMELLNGTGAYPEYQALNIHQGLNETYSVSKKIETVQIHVNNYELPDVETDFSLVGSQKLMDQKPMRIRRGKHYRISGVNKYWNVYDRQIYAFRVEQEKLWHLNKYNALNQLVDEFDSSKYIVGGVPLAGAYPIAWCRRSEPGLNFEGMEQSIWFKLHNNGTLISNTNLVKLITCELPNFLSQKNTFLFFDWDVAYCMGYGDVNTWDRGWYDDYNADDRAPYSPNYDECAVAISPIIGDDASEYIKRSVNVGMSIKFTNLSGTVSYWYPLGNTPGWTTNALYSSFTIPSEDLFEFKFGSIRENYIVSPRMADGSPAIFDTAAPTGKLWVRLPESLGKLEISFGGSNIFDFKSLLFRNLQIDRMIAKNEVSEIDLSLEDVLYSNTNSTEIDRSVTFYMYSTNLKSGRGQLFINNADQPLDELHYTNVGQEKPEWHAIRIYEKSISKSKIYRDIFMLSDIKMNYSDRYFNGGTINLMSGIIEAEYVKSSMNIGGDI
jgi:hypothetical protein